MNENNAQPKGSEGFKKLTFRQALIVLGHGGQIQTLSIEEEEPVTFRVEENGDFIGENQGYMDLYEFAYEQWYTALDVYEKVSEEEEKAASLELHKPSTPLSEWTDEDLEWGLVGCGHDREHALDLIKEADTEEAAYAAGLEFLNVMATRAAYKKEQFRRWEEQQ